MTKCKECDGTGKYDYICGFCNGSGEGFHEGSICGVCKGAGGMIDDCEDCNGTGEVDDDE